MASLSLSVHSVWLIMRDTWSRCKIAVLLPIHVWYSERVYTERHPHLSYSEVYYACISRSLHMHVSFVTVNLWSRLLNGGITCKMFHCVHICGLPELWSFRLHTVLCISHMIHLSSNDLTVKVPIFVSVCFHEDIQCEKQSCRHTVRLERLGEDRL